MAMLGKFKYFKRGIAWSRSHAWKIITNNPLATMATLSQKTHTIRKGFALVIVNEKFDIYSHREGADFDRKKIKKFCEDVKFTAINDIKGLNLEDTSDLKFNHKGELNTDNLTAKEMINYFDTISKGDFSPYDAFVCFVSSHGDEGRIVGIDGQKIPVRQIVDKFKASAERTTLAGKPKLFFIQNCRGSRIDYGIRVPDNDDGDEFDDVENDCKVPITIPIEADVLIAYSSVDGYESYRNTKTGSWFITKLTEVLHKHAHHTNLMDMLNIANKEVAEIVSEKGKKQMPCFTSTLRKAVHFQIVKSSVQVLKKNYLSKKPSRTSCKAL